MSDHFEPSPPRQRGPRQEAHRILGQLSAARSWTSLVSRADLAPCESWRAGRGRGPIPATEVWLGPRFVSSTLGNEIDGRVLRQPFATRVYSDEELSDELERAGLRLRLHLTRRWAEASELPAVRGFARAVAKPTIA